jgi:heat-inducible transcriptional repressor
VDAATVRSVQLVSLSSRVVMIVIVLSNGAVLHRNLEHHDDVPVEDVTAASAHLTAHLVDGTVGRLPDVAPTGNPPLDALVDEARAAIVAATDPDGAPVFVGGASRMAAAFDTVETVRKVLLTLEQQIVVVSLLRDVIDRGLSVAIGQEHGVQPLASCSVVVAPYLVDGEPAGAVGILGPTRMDYPQALATVSVVSDRLGRRLSEG